MDLDCFATEDGRGLSRSETAGRNPKDGIPAHFERGGPGMLLLLLPGKTGRPLPYCASDTQATQGRSERIWLAMTEFTAMPPPTKGTP